MERKDSRTKGNQLGSPADLNSERFDSFGRPHMQRSDSASSFRSNRNPNSPRISTGLTRPLTSDDSRRGHRVSLSNSPQAVGPDTESIKPRRLKRNSGSHHSIHSPSSPTSPVYHVPRSSSLQGGKSPPAPARSSSARNSLTTVASPSELKEEIAYIEEERMKGKDQSQESSWRNSTTSVKYSSAAGAAGAGAIAAIRAKFGDGKESIDDTMDSLDFTKISPQSMETAKQELSPSSLVLTKELPSEDTRPLIVPSNDESSLRLPVARPSEEPKRPTKSPLRISTGSSTVEALQHLPRPSPYQSQERRVASAPVVELPKAKGSSIGSAKMKSDLSRSPPRQSIGEVVQLDAVTFGQPLPAGRLSISPSSPYPEPRPSNEVRLQPVPESAKRLGALIRSSTELETMTNNVSTTSLTTEDENLGEEKPIRGFSKRYRSLRKVTPPVLANAFTKTAAKSNVLPESVTEEEVSDVSGRGENSARSTTPSSKRKTTKKWSTLR